MTVYEKGIKSTDFIITFFFPPPSETSKDNCVNLKTYMVTIFLEQPIISIIISIWFISSMLINYRFSFKYIITIVCDSFFALLILRIISSQKLSKILKKYLPKFEFRLVRKCGYILIRKSSNKNWNYKTFQFLISSSVPCTLCQMVYSQKNAEIVQTYARFYQ